MDRPEDKRRVTISYIVAAVLLVAVVTASQVYVAYRARQRAAANAESEGTSVSDTAEVQSESAEEAQSDTNSGYEQITAGYSTYDVYRYRTLTDTEELSAMGLSASVKEEDLGGKFATADNQIVLYAYPKYACRAILIANNSDKYSFCVLDSVTDRSKVSDLGEIAIYYGIYSAEDILSIEATGSDGAVTSISGGDISKFYDSLPSCANTSSGGAGGNSTVTLKIRTGNTLTLFYDGTKLSVLGESFTPSGDVKTLLGGIAG